jgi:hypothetical protein
VSNLSPEVKDVLHHPRKQDYLWLLSQETSEDQVNVNEPDNYRQTALHLALDHGAVFAPQETIAVVASGVQTLLRVISLFLRFPLWFSGRVRC